MITSQKFFQSLEIGHIPFFETRVIRDLVLKLI